MKEREIGGSSVLILGYGREGQSTHRYLHQHYPEKEIGIADQKEEIKPAVDSPVNLHTGEEYLKNICRYDVIVRSPGVPLNLPELKHSIEEGRQLTSATNIFFSECPGMIVGVTGTKGKSTTSSLTAQVLEKEYPDVRLVGNIGRPALDYLAGSEEQTIFVVELSNFQLEDIRYSPHVAIILNIVPEHLDRYNGDFSQYAEAKGKILQFQTPDDIVIFNPAHHLPDQLTSRCPARKYRFSLEPGNDSNLYLEDKNIFLREGNSKPQFVMTREEIPLMGEGNLENTLAAISAGLVLNVPLEKIRKAVAEFKALEHRLEFVGKYRGIRFFNDSLATIPEATIHALRALGSEVATLIAGGHERGLDFSKLGEFLGETQVKTLILFPPTGAKIWQVVSQFTPKEKWPQKHEVSSMEEAVKIAFETTPSGKICLLSPASASFGLFRDYDERGKLFKRLVSQQKD